MAKWWPYTATYTVEAKLRLCKLDNGRGEAESIIEGIQSQLRPCNLIIPRSGTCAGPCSFINLIVAENWSGNCIPHLTRSLKRVWKGYNGYVSGGQEQLNKQTTAVWSRILNMDASHRSWGKFESYGFTYFEIDEAMYIVQMILYIFLYIIWMIFKKTKSMTLPLKPFMHHEKNITIFY